MQNLNKEIIKKNFSHKAADYENWALMQKKSAQKLVNLAENFCSDEAKILDLGSGTGFVAREILKISPAAQIIETDLSPEMLSKWQRPSNVSALVCDIENLPFKDEKFDIIFSSFALHWLNNFEKSFANFCKILAPKAIIAICLPCFPSLDELSVFNINKFPEIEKIIHLLEKNNLQKIHYEKEVYIEEFTDIISAAKSLKKIGGNYNQKQILTQKKLMQLRKLYLKNSDKSLKFKLSWHNAFLIYQKND